MSYPGLKKITYAELNNRQKETYNFQKVSAKFAEYGITTIKLSDDWNGADFIALQLDGTSFFRVQLKGRLTFDKKYIGKNIHICFPYKDEWYLVPHDEALNDLQEYGIIVQTQSWEEDGLYSFKSISSNVLSLINHYQL